MMSGDSITGDEWGKRFEIFIKEFDSLKQEQLHRFGLDIVLKEFEALKQEQLQRIGVRDNVIYLNILVAAALIGVLDKFNSGAPLLLLPWVCVLMGWTYLINDEKVSAIGRYVRFDLADKIKSLMPEVGSDWFGWEIAHRSDKDRLARKRLQLVIDMLAFVVPGVAALALYLGYFLANDWGLLVVFLEAAALTMLAVRIYRYADLQVGK